MQTTVAGNCLLSYTLGSYTPSNRTTLESYIPWDHIFPQPQIVQPWDRIPPGIIHSLNLTSYNPGIVYPLGSYTPSTSNRTTLGPYIPWDHTLPEIVQPWDRIPPGIIHSLKSYNPGIVYPLGSYTPSTSNRTTLGSYTLWDHTLPHIVQPWDRLSTGIIHSLKSYNPGIVYHLGSYTPSNNTTLGSYTPWHHAPPGIIPNMQEQRLGWLKNFYVKAKQKS